MTLYEIKKYKYGTRGAVANYGGGYTAEDLKTILRGYRKDAELSDERTACYIRNGSSFYYIVDSYTR